MKCFYFKMKALSKVQSQYNIEVKIKCKCLKGSGILKTGNVMYRHLMYIFIYFNIERVDPLPHKIYKKNKII